MREEGAQKNRNEGNMGTRRRRVFLVQGKHNSKKAKENTSRIGRATSSGCAGDSCGTRAPSISG